MSRMLRFYSVLAVLLAVSAGGTVWGAQTILTNEQNAWLDKNKRTIVVHPQESYPPYVFTGLGIKKEVRGFSVDYIRAIAEKLNISITFSEPAPLDQIFAGALDRSTGVILSVTPTDEREQFLYFTDSYYESPAIIAVRKDYSTNKSVVTLSDFSGKKVAVGDTYAVESFVRSNYPKVVVVSVMDDQIGLQKLLLGDVDAVVMDLGSFSYYTSNDVLSYIKVIGRTGFEYRHSIAVPRSSPELALILDEGMKSLSSTEKQLITNKWLDVDIPQQEISASAGESGNPLGTWLLFTGFIILIFATIIIVAILRRRNMMVPVRGHFHKKDIVSEVQDEFQELKAAREALKEDMLEVAQLEKDIEEKMQNLK